MKGLTLIALWVLSVCSIQAQSDPTEWSTEVEKLSNNEYLLTTTALIEPGWHVYSQASSEENRGPVATTLSFYDAEAKIELLGPNKENGSYAEYSDVWGFNVYQFADLAVFEQKIKVLDPNLEYLVAEAFYQTCDDERCLRPTGVPLYYKINPEASIPEDAGMIIETYLDEEREPLVAQAPAEKDIPVKEGHSGNPPPTKEEVKKKEAELEPSSPAKDEEDRSLWGIFIVSFLAGFAALLTPCVFPMIPLTVSFFTKQSKNRASGIRKAFLYGFFIILVYVVLGSAVTALFGDRILNSMATNPWLNLSFFLVLVIFAISFFGAFEITLPQSWANRVDANANKGGIIGIFFMALALAIISFSCTGPIVGSLILESSTKGGIAPIIGMFGFSLALALPFTLFAIFPGWMNSLPKSGGWLNTVKVVLGFLELALALKFLSSADLVYQFHFLEREVFLALWIAVSTSLALYLFGKIRLPHDGPEQPISVGRFLLGLLTLAVTLYMLPGLWGAPLKIISGFPPPLNYAESPYGVGYSKVELKEELPEGAHLAVHDIISFHDYEEGMAYAKEVGKPVLLDFTGWACVNCRKMEERVWSDPRILPILKNDVVLISLYVDDANKLPEDQQYESDIIDGKVRTIGDKWYELQKKEYNNAAQPYYAILDQNGNKVGEPVGYTPDIEEYLEWLLENTK
ncbi:protein-disulfide reductase DsbD family protein [Nonlabens xiamenensis]|uniref:protein-disulfide reductase DsbD family protein n=1 Tax=Nonlabens xiamenensis TaxID=2341043 RepID=UPI000F604801|nr:thioredoxin family protein [Nonlabens xiamenensis]